MNAKEHPTITREVQLTKWVIDMQDQWDPVDQYQNNFDDNLYNDDVLMMMLYWYYGNEADDDEAIDLWLSRFIWTANVLNSL